MQNRADKTRAHHATRASGGLSTEVSDGDVVVFISTLHGG